MKYILIANGSFAPGPAVDALLHQQATDPSITIIAVDGGANHTQRLNITPSLIVGDLDSVLPTTLTYYQSCGIAVQEYPSDKDETDLELALLEAVQRKANWIRILAAIGDRLDQTLANIDLLALPQLAAIDTKIVSGKQSIWLLEAGEHPLMGEVGDTISLVPFGGPAVGITTHGLSYPLHQETLYKGPARGISNVIADHHPSIILENGKLLVIHTIGQA